MLFTRRPSVPLRSPSATWFLRGAPRNVFLRKSWLSQPNSANELLLKSSVSWLKRAAKTAVLNLMVGVAGSCHDGL